MTRKILIIGATGYVGGRLVPKLVEAGYRVRCLVRSRRKAEGRSWANKVELHEGDALDQESVASAMTDVDTVYFLMHSMAAGGGKFEDLDRQAAENVVQAAESAGVQRIIYLGGLGKYDDKQSPHLRSRHEVGRILRSGTVPVFEFRAGIIVGSGSLSFEIVHHLVNRLPVMICPKWVYTKTQPIAVADVLRYLLASLKLPGSRTEVIDIGGPDVLTFRDMMLKVAEVLGLRRQLLQVPVLTPRLSSYWVNLVTPVQTDVARELIESLRHETVCENDRAQHLFQIEPMGFTEAVQKALAHITSHDVETAWTDASSSTVHSQVDPSHLRRDVRQITVAAPVESVFSVISSVGGQNGWYYANLLWQIRGFIDKQLGGVGLRRGRRHPTDMAVGDALDFWRVEEYEPLKKLSLRAEMKVWGQAWLDFEVEQIDDKATRLIQTARYYPRGLFGLFYWYAVYPLHVVVFAGMAKALARHSEMIYHGMTDRNNNTASQV